jgi:hypothetical protein
MIIRDELYEVSEVNTNLEITTIKTDHLKYLKISNFLKYPNDFISVFSQYPALVGPSYITTAGARQNFTPIEVRNILVSYQKILQSIHLHVDPIKWISSTNIMWDGMACMTGSNKPHYDATSMVANLWLSDHGGGTAFYRYQENKYNKSDLVGNDNIFTDLNPTLQTWTNFEGDYEWKKYHLIPTEFNTVYIYDGTFFHAPYPKLNSNYRYSLVSFYHDNINFSNMI